MSKAGKAPVAVTAAAAAIACHSAAAEPTASVDYRDAFTTKKPGAPSGRIFHDEFFNASDRPAKPPAVQHVHIQLPRGARFNWRAVPQCTASDARVMAQGESVCPAGSRGGGEAFPYDTGVPGPNRLVTSDITFLSNKNELIVRPGEPDRGT